MKSLSLVYVKIRFRAVRRNVIDTARDDNSSLRYKKNYSWYICKLKCNKKSDVPCPCVDRNNGNKNLRRCMAGVRSPVYLQVFKDIIRIPMQSRCNHQFEVVNSLIQGNDFLNIFYCPPFGQEGLEVIV